MSCSLAISEHGAVDITDSVRRHCEIAVWQCGRGVLDLHDAVDRLQSLAGPLIDLIGQDAVQAIMAEAFRPLDGILKRDAFLAAYKREWEANRANRTATCSLSEMLAIVEAARRRRGVPKSTLDAADYVRRQGDPEKLQRWLDQHSEYLPGILEGWRNG